jgi:two-component system nitrate/nitrite response regulator NarL
VTARLAIVDDHELFAQSLAIALRAHGFHVSAHVPDDISCLLGDLLRDPPDVVLLDLQLGDGMHGLSLVQPLTAAGARVLVVTGVTDRCELAATLEAGAVGYVSKSQPVELLLETATAVARGTQVMSDGARHALLAELRAWRVQDRAAHSPYLRLTPRERSVLHALATGDAVADIAARDVVTVATVRTQVRAILLKLGVCSQLEAVALAHRRGWFERDSPIYRIA